MEEFAFFLLTSLPKSCVCLPAEKGAKGEFTGSLIK